ncbi:MAG: AAC(3) family N-acetyltransferase [Erysipelotrichaceae bacterium]
MSVLTKDELKTALHQAGIHKGSVVYVEADLTNFPKVLGGEQTIILALQEVIGYEGTILMPAFTDLAKQIQLLDREQWEYARHMALHFHKKTTLPDHHDSLYTQFLVNDGVVRSNHPRYSFMAWGKYARVICDKHPLHFGLSLDSPLGKVMKLNGIALMLGAPLHQNAFLKLIQYEFTNSVVKVHQAPVLMRSITTWVDLLELQFSASFEKILAQTMQEELLVKEVKGPRVELHTFKMEEARQHARQYS